MHLFEGTILLEKFTGKGGWTYARIPATVKQSGKPFGWVVVSGSIDALQFEKVKLMPTGDGHLFLPVKKAWRQALAKECGDTVSIILYAADIPDKLPHAAIELLDLFPECRQRYHSLPRNVQQEWIERIHTAPDEQQLEKLLGKFVDFLREQ